MDKEIAQNRLLSTVLAIFLLMTSMTIFSHQCQSQDLANDLKFISATVIVRDIKASAAWYRKYLRFKPTEYKPNKHVKMQKEGFQLILKQGRNTLLVSQIQLPKDKKFVHGFDKIGFSTNQIDSLYLYYSQLELKLSDSIITDPNLGHRYFITRDTDGNKIRISEKKSSNPQVEITPNFFSIISSDYLHTLSWYRKNLNFEDMKLIDDADKSLNLLTNGSIILEVLHMPFESLEITEFMDIDRDLASFSALKFSLPNGKNSAFDLDNNGNRIQLLK